MLRRHLLWWFAAVIVLWPASAAERTYEDYWNEAIQKPHKLSVSAKCTEIVTDSAVYLFTTPDNPDHPALFIRRMLMKNGKMYVVTEAHSYRPGATNPDVKAWMIDPFTDPAQRKPQ